MLSASPQTRTRRYLTPLYHIYLTKKKKTKIDKNILRLKICKFLFTSCTSSEISTLARRNP